MESLGGEIGITWWGEFLLQIFDDVEWQTADQSDDTHLPQEHPCGDKRKIWRQTKQKKKIKRQGQSVYIIKAHFPHFVKKKSVRLRMRCTSPKECSEKWVITGLGHIWMAPSHPGAHTTPDWNLREENGHVCGDRKLSLVKQQRTRGKTNLPKKAPKVMRPMPEAQSQNRDGEKEESLKVVVIVHQSKLNIQWVRKVFRPL